MLDSNVVLKHLFGEWNISELLALTEPYYNDIVYSEVLYLIIRNESGERPFTLKKKPELVVKSSQAIKPALKLFEVLNYSPISEHTLWEAEKLIERYGLLPGDAIILANCIEMGLDALLTWDSDLLRVNDEISKCMITTPAEYLLL
ncbi:type II toxin-antitoxin system VapC family toxin [Thermococcus sp. JdF3]|uniref:type II toxin-antitoxin system VapC family toxin n=1 Tax=Thermococcus sp. JdF3 TaxID=1638258 RepID=UPI001F0E0FED|nr:type II toxin-antitoxin system VapC family toxin [Thermococcus sp. JdF3]